MSVVLPAPLPAAATGFYHILYDAPPGRAPTASVPPACLRRLTEGFLRQHVPLVAYSVTGDSWQCVAGPVGKTRLLRVLARVVPTRAGRLEPACHVLPVDDVAELVPLVRFVERAARSAGRVDRAEAWPWCSLAQRLRGAPEPRLVDAGFLASPTWVAYVNAALTDTERDADAIRRRPMAS